MKTIYKEENIRGFFKGAKSAVVSVPIFYALYFPIYEFSKTFYSKKIYDDPKRINSVVYSLAATSTAFICDFITNPLWVVRIRYQTEYLYTGSQKMDSFNVFKMIRQLYHEVYSNNIRKASGHYIAAS